MQQRALLLSFAAPPMRQLHPRALLVLLGWIFAGAAAAAAEVPNPRFTGAAFTRTWLADDYGAAPANRAILQHPQNGFIYVGNGAGVLEFDGARWRLLPVPGGLAVSALAVDGRGRIWFATDDDVGCFQADEVGELRAVSARPRLPAGEPSIFPLGSCLATHEGVYFANRDRIFRFGADDAPARIWRFETELFPRLWLMDGAVHVRTGNAAARLVDDEFKPVGGLRTFAFAARADPAGGWQMISRDGVRRWADTYQPVAPGAGVLRSPFGGDFALNGAFLSNGRIVFGTTRSGLIICDAQGVRVQTIDRGRGLPSNRIEALCVDRTGGVWLALRNGIVRVQLDSPYAIHASPDARIDSSPQALALHDGQLYVGGGEGLSRRDDAGVFHPVADVPYLVRSLVPHAGRLFVTGIELREVLSNDRTRALDTTYFGLVPLAGTPGYFVHGNASGLSIDQANGEKWQRIAQHEKISDATTALAEWPAGVVWASNHDTGLWRIDFRGGLKSDAPARNFGPADGLPARLNQYNVTVFPLGAEVAVIAAGRLLRFDEAAGRFVPETRIDGLPRNADGVTTALRVSPPERDGSFWLQLRNPSPAIVKISPASSGRWQAEATNGPPLSRLRVTALLHDSRTNSLWIGAAGALISQDLTWKPASTDRDFVATIRRLERANGSLIWADGNAFAAGPRRADSTPAPSSTPTALPATLKAPDNALRVRFAAANFAADHLGRSLVRFRTRLEGLDSDWTPWSVETHRDFTSLPYRHFVFKVEAQDDQGRTSPAASLAFSIAPPWWLTRGAQGGYVLLALAAIAGLVRWRTRSLRRRAEALETVVATRTEELRQSNARLAELNAIERDEKLAARLAEEKARLEVLRYQLNPHFLFNSLSSVCAQIMREPGAARAMVVRIADFCRQTLRRPGEEEVPPTVSQELNMLRAYLEIEQARLGELLTVEIDADPEAGPMRLPPFLVIPLVENAVKYGSATSPERVQIRLTVRVEGDGDLCIEVANTGEWLTPGAHSVVSTGIGLENVRQRLARYYPNRHEFSTEGRDGWVTVRLRLLAPLREYAHAHR